MRNPAERACPYCQSRNTAPAEREYTSDYPFWIVLAVVFIMIAAALALFFLLQLHPVILILVLVAIVSKFLNVTARKRKRRKKVEYICLECDQRFPILENSDD